MCTVLQLLNYRVRVTVSAFGLVVLQCAYLCYYRLLEFFNKIMILQKCYISSVKIFKLSSVNLSCFEDSRFVMSYVSTCIVSNCTVDQKQKSSVVDVAQAQLAFN